jgi:hypothetical protein
MLKRIVLFAFAACLMGSSLSAADKKEKKEKKEKKKGKWETLFEGHSVDKWRGYKKDAFPDNAWLVEDGTLHTNPKADPVDIVTKENYDNFELQLEWRVTPGANSGIMYHVGEDFEEAWYTGPEMQVLDDEKHPDGKDPRTSAGALYALIAPHDKEFKPVGEWNHVRLIVKGNHVEHWLNEKKIVEYELGSPELQKLIAQSKFADKPKFAKLSTGHIVLQHHHDEVWYRNIRVRKLKVKEAE